tara:strand:- start:2426 stop:2884 length:459 start_codon:yes stop_codon:yes gene_type:complete
MSKKKFKDTKIAEFLKNKAPGILNVVGDVLPNNGAFGIIKNLITKDLSLSSKDKDTAMKIIDQDIAEMKEVSDRWAADMKSDSWLSKNTRPMSLIFLTLMTVALIWVDSIEYASFSVDIGWVNLLQTLTTTVYVAYFGSRGAEKWKTLSNNK